MDVKQGRTGMRNKVKLLLLVCLSVRGEEKELLKDKDFLNPAHPTWWMVVQAPDLPLRPNPTGQADLASPQTASPKQAKSEGSSSFDSVE